MTVGEVIRTPEERAMGLLFKLGHSLTSRDAVERGGATIVGTGTTFGPDGMTLNGSGNLRYAVAGSSILRSTLTFVFEFTLGFAPDDGVLHYVCTIPDSTGPNHLYVAKTAVNALTMYAAGLSSFFSTVYAAWSPFVVAGKNTLIVSVANGVQTAWLNGNAIGTGTGTWTESYFKKYSSIIIGANHVSASRWIGTISRVEIYGNVSTAVDEPYLRQGTLISKLDDYLVAIPGTSYYKRDSDGLYVTDVLGKAGITEALMGSDGTTTTQFPKVARSAGLVRGFSFDGGDQITIPDADALSFTTGSADLPFSIAMIVKGTVTGNWSIVYKGSGFGASDYGEYEIYCPYGGAVWAVYVLLSDATLGGLIYINAAAAIKTGIPHVLIVTYNGGGSAGLKIYRDGTLLSSSVGSSGVYTCMRNTSAPLVFGRGRTAYLTGEQALQIIDNVEWSPMQVRALTARLRYQSRTP